MNKKRVNFPCMEKFKNSITSSSIYIEKKSSVLRISFSLEGPKTVIRTSFYIFQTRTKSSQIPDSALKEYP